MTTKQTPGSAGVLSNAIAALKPYGPTPVVSVAIGGVGLSALAVGADTVGVIVVVGMSLAAYLWGQERKAKWRRAELEAEFDALAKGDARAIRARLDEKLKRALKKNKPTLVATKEASNDSGN